MQTPGTLSDWESSPEFLAKREAARQTLNGRGFLSAPFPVELKGFELVHEEGDGDHAVRVLAKRVLFGTSPTIWCEVWIARDPETAADLLTRALETHARTSGARPTTRDVDGDAAAVFRELTDGHEAYAIFARTACIVHKIATLKVSAQDALAVASGQLLLGRIASQ